MFLPVDVAASPRNPKTVFWSSLDRSHMNLAAMEDKRAKSICKVFHSLAHEVALAPLVPQGGLQCFSPALAGVHIHMSLRQNSYSQKRPHLSWVSPIGKQHLLGVSVLGFPYW